MCDQLIKDIGKHMIPNMMALFVKHIHQRCHLTDELLRIEDIEQKGEWHMPLKAAVNRGQNK